MKRVIFLAIFLLTNIVCSAQELPEMLSRYQKACFSLIAAIESQPSKNALYSVQEELEAVKTLDFSVFIPADDATRKNREKPVIMFTPEYIDTLIAHNCQLVELDSLSLLRGIDDGEIFIQHAAIAPDATLSWKSEAYDGCAMLLVWFPQAELSLSVTDLTTGQVYEAANDSGSPSASVFWQMPPFTGGKPKPNFLITINNKSQKKVSFVIAMN